MRRVKYRDLDYAVKAYLDLVEEILSLEEQQFHKQTQQPQSQDELQMPKDSRAQLRECWRNNYTNHRDSRRTKYARKSDIKSAFRILGLSRDSWKWFIMKAQDPTTGEFQYFVDKCLPFGANISCALFQRFSNTLCHLIEFQVKVYKRITNYLDDFLFLVRTLQLCDYMIDQFLELCQEIGVQIAIEKTEWGAETVIFLGILLDGKNLLLAIPLEKREVAIQLLTTLMNKKKATVRDLRSCVDS